MKELADKTIDFSVLVKKLVDEGRLSLKEGQKLGKITYHDSCHLKRTLKVSEQPRELLQGVGYELTEMFECDTCCGMGGSYSMKLPGSHRSAIFSRALRRPWAWRLAMACGRLASAVNAWRSRRRCRSARGLPAGSESVKGIPEKGRKGLRSGRPVLDFMRIDGEFVTSCWLWIMRKNRRVNGLVDSVS